MSKQPQIRKQVIKKKSWLEILRTRLNPKQPKSLRLNQTQKVLFAAYCVFTYTWLWIILTGNPANCDLEHDTLYTSVYLFIYLSVGYWLFSKRYNRERAHIRKRRRIMAEETAVRAKKMEEQEAAKKAKKTKS